MEGTIGKRYQDMNYSRQIRSRSFDEPICLQGIHVLVFTTHGSLREGRITKVHNSVIGSASVRLFKDFGYCPNTNVYGT